MESFAFFHSWKDSYFFSCCNAELNDSTTASQLATESDSDVSANNDRNLANDKNEMASVAPALISE
jgi:hypothetical protein